MQLSDLHVWKPLYGKFKIDFKSNKLFRKVKNEYYVIFTEKTISKNTLILNSLTV